MDAGMQRLCERQGLGFEIRRAVRNGRTQPYFSYLIRRQGTDEIVIDGYAADIAEAAQSVALHVQYLANHPEAA